MYFYSIRPLKERLAAGPLTERESLPYLLTFVVATALAASLPAELESGWDWAELVMSGILAVLGTWVIYRANGGATGHDFVHRYVVLGWVVAVRFGTLVFPAFVVFLLAAHGAGFSPDSEPLFQLAASFFVEVTFILYFSLHLDDLRDRTLEVRGGGREVSS